MHSPQNSDRLFIFMPFDFNFELNISGSFARSEKEHTFDRLREKLVSCATKAKSDFDWSSTEENNTTPDRNAVGYNTDDFTADSIRPEYICRATLRPASKFFKECEPHVSSGNCRLVNVSIDFHDFGIGVLVAKLGFEPPLDKTTGEILEEFAKTLQEPLGNVARRFASEIFLVIRQCELEFADDTCSLIHRNCQEPSGEEMVEARMLWFHSLIQVKHSESSVDLEQWKKAVLGTNKHVTSEHWFDGAFSFRGVVPLEFECRELTAFVQFGWGNTIAFFPEEVDSIAANKSFPLLRVLRLLQAFSAGLYLLNREIIYETIPSVQSSRETMTRKDLGMPKKVWGLLTKFKKTLLPFDRSTNRAQSYDREVILINRLRFRTRLFISLLGERRYSYSARQFKLWDGAFQAWGMTDLQNYIFENLDILRSVFEQKRDEEERRFQNRLNFSLALVSIASVAAVFFDIIVQVFDSGWDSPITVSHYSVLILVALVAYLVARR